MSKLPHSNQETMDQIEVVNRAEEGDFPMHDVLKFHAERSQLIGEFIEWLNDTKGVQLCVLDESRYSPNYIPINKRTEEILAEYFNIDLNVLEKEKLEMIKLMRRAQGDKA